MRINNRYIKAVFKLTISVLGFYGLALSMNIFTPKPDFSLLRFFTDLSNLLSAAYFLAAAVVILFSKKNIATFFPLLKGIVTMSLTLTMLVAHFMLGGCTSGGIFSLSLLFLHYICPIMVIIDWLLFDEKSLVKWYYPLLWVAAPLVYLGFTMLSGYIARCEGKLPQYPYWFLDVDILGVRGVITYVLVLLAAFTALGYVFFAADKLTALIGAKKKDLAIR